MSIGQQIGLAEITEPGPVSQWPAIGWWLLLVVIVAVSVACARYGIKYWHKKQRIKKTLQTLEQVCEGWTPATTSADFCGQLNILLKRHLAQAGFHHTLSLYGPPWRDFLQQHIASKHHSDVAAFLDQLYRPEYTSVQDNRDAESFIEDHTTNAMQWPQHIKIWLRSLPC